MICLLIQLTRVRLIQLILTLVEMILIADTFKDAVKFQNAYCSRQRCISGDPILFEDKNYFSLGSADTCLTLSTEFIFG